MTKEIYIEASEKGGWKNPKQSQQSQSGVVFTVSYETLLGALSDVNIVRSNETVSRLRITQQGIDVFVEGNINPSNKSRV